MKKLFLLQILLLCIAAPLYFSSCDDSDDGEQVLIPNLDGFYVFGTNTIAASPSEPAARMNPAILDIDKPPNVADEDGVFGKLIYIGANSQIQFVKVLNKEGTIYGAADGGSVDIGLDIDNVPIDDDVVHGTLVADGPKIEVAEEGLYYAFANINTGTFVLMKVKPNMIGDTMPGGWDVASEIPQIKLSRDSAVFEATNLTLKGESGYKYRLNAGWAVYEETGVLTTLTSLGVVDYGVSWGLPTNDIGFYQQNTPHQTTGIFTVHLKYNIATGIWTEKKTKTGNVLIDYTNHEMAIIGTATTGGSWNGDGTGGYGQRKPTKAGTVYTWTWDDVPFLQDNEFIFLQDAHWPPNHLLIAFDGAAVDGNAVTESKIINAKSAPVNGPDANFHVITGGSYDVKLVIDAATEGRTVTITTNP